MTHITSVRSNLAITQYRKRYEKLGRKYSLPYKETWYSHKPESVIKQHECNMLSDFPIQRDEVLELRQPCKTNDHSIIKLRKCESCE